MIALCLLLVLQERPDPLTIVRQMADRGDLADAFEAAAGLPEPLRAREEAFLRYRAVDPEGTRECAMRALERDPNDAAMLRLLATSEAMLGRVDRAFEVAARARRALEGAAAKRGTEPDAAEAGALRALEVYLRGAREYYGRIEGAETRMRIALAFVVAAGALLAIGAFGLALKKSS